MHWEKFHFISAGGLVEIGPIYLNKGLNVIFGFNGAGKSRTLKRILALGQLHKRPEVFLLGKYECIIGDKDLGFFDYSFEIGDTGDDDFEEIVKSDKLTKGNETIFNREANIIKNETTAELEKYSPEEKVLTINYARDKEKHKTIQALKTFLTSFRAFDDSLSTTHRARLRDEEDDVVDGSNTEALIIDLQKNHKDEYKRFSENLTDILPSIKRLSVRNYGAGRDRPINRLAIEEEGVDSQYLFNSASAGYKKVFVILALLFHPRETSLIVLDEVEDGLDYDVLKKTVDLLQRFGNRKQIVVTTHSPNLANTVDLENWHVAKREKNSIKFFRIKKDEKLIELKRLGTPNYDLFVKELLTFDEEA
jgi:predicted ATPase